LRTRIAPNDLRFILRADERLTAFLELESVKQRFQRVGTFVEAGLADRRGARGLTRPAMRLRNSPAQ